MVAVPPPPPPFWRGNQQLSFFPRPNVLFLFVLALAINTFHLLLLRQEQSTIFFFYHHHHHDVLSNNHNDSTTRTTTAVVRHKNKKKNHNNHYNDTHPQLPLSLLFGQQYSSNEKRYSSSSSSSNLLPTWLKDYIIWHQQQRNELLQQTSNNHTITNNNTNNNNDDNWWRSYRYLIMTCKVGQSCGGTSDRLRPSLALVKLAANTKRIFFIYWEHPVPLETFLIPPPSSSSSRRRRQQQQQQQQQNYRLDWRLPQYLIPKVKSRRTGIKNFNQIRPLAEGTSVLVLTQYQSANYGAKYYNENITTTAATTEAAATSTTTKATLVADKRASNKDADTDTGVVIVTGGSSSSEGSNETIIVEMEKSMEEVFSHFWKVMFTPAPIVATKIRQQLDRLGLIPGGYVGVHVRTYQIEPPRRGEKNKRKTTTIDDDYDNKFEQVQRDVHNAIHCGTKLFVGKQRKQQKENATATTTTAATTATSIPIFFSSDSVEATEMAIDYGRSNNIAVFGAGNNDNNGGYNNINIQKNKRKKMDPIHLGFAPDATTTATTTIPNNKNTSQADDDNSNVVVATNEITEQLTDVFVDLYMLSLAKCVAYGTGGFGQLAHLLSQEQCGFRHGKYGRTCSFA